MENIKTSIGKHNGFPGRPKLFCPGRHVRKRRDYFVHCTSHESCRPLFNGYKLKFSAMVNPGQVCFIVFLSKIGLDESVKC
jgi:hypothetical protein